MKKHMNAYHHYHAMSWHHKALEVGVGSFSEYL